MQHYTPLHDMPSLIISSGAAGVDTLVGQRARHNGVAVRECVWLNGTELAGHVRNSDIMNGADRVIAIQINNSRRADSIQKAKS